MKFKLLFCGLLALLISAGTFAESPSGTPAAKSGALKNAVILIIRHAEKPASGSGLSADGENRARLYADYFKNFTVAGQPLKPDYLFAAADSKRSCRSRLTLEPTAKALGLTVDTRFKNEAFQALAETIQTKPPGRTILIAWHHGKIPALVRALGADSKSIMPQGKWPDDVYNWLIELRYAQDGHLLEAKRINEKLLPGDAD